jgi:hypothetical protein
MTTNKKEDNTVRSAFRDAVFTRDKYTCIVPGCGRPAVDAHHIIERALWTDPAEQGGYFKENGASLCAIHHIDAEKGYLTPTALRHYAGISKVYLPKGFDPALDYTKWGAVLKSPSRQSIKYPHTSYLTISPGFDPDDVRDGKTIDATAFIGMNVIVTTKMDGSNVFFDTGKVAARNGQDATHISFDMAKAVHARIRDKIPAEYQVFCEWLYAKHSIHYTGTTALDNYCQVITVYNRQTHEFMSWDSTVKVAERLGLPTVPVLCSGIRVTDQTGFNRLMFQFGTAAIKSGHEGIVVRNIESFHHSTFGTNVGKFVRENHVSTSKHWMAEKVVRNEVKRV